jgi:hypothetical protein
MRGNANHGTRLKVAKAVKISMHLLLLRKRPKSLLGMSKVFRGYLRMFSLLVLYNELTLRKVYEVLQGWLSRYPES